MQHTRIYGYRIKELCYIETSLYYDARSETRQISLKYFMFMVPCILIISYK